MRIKRWVKYLLIELLVLDGFLLVLYLYMLRLLEIGR